MKISDNIQNMLSSNSVSQIEFEELVTKINTQNELINDKINRNTNMINCSYVRVTDSICENKIKTDKLFGISLCFNIVNLGLIIWLILQLK